MRCDKCGATFSPEDAFHHAGQTLCEDCYLDIMATPKACDPWAVHSAKRTAEQQTILTPVQEKILALIRENGPLTAQEICEKAGLSENEFQRNFATLRHMELARAFKAEDGVRYTPFDK